MKFKHIDKSVKNNLMKFILKIKMLKFKLKHLKKYYFKLVT
jgi:hypothetical protein